jgi:octaprenyl-diphosphate synthase
MAFQIADDLLDYTASASVTGKPSGQDLREHKVTLPLIAALREVQPRDRGYIEAFFADPEPRDEQIQRIMEIVQAYGGLEYARQRAEYGDKAAATCSSCRTHQPRTRCVIIAYVIERHN